MYTNTFTGDGSTVEVSYIVTNGIDGNDAAIARTKYLAEVGNALGGAGVYWSVAKP